VVRLIGLAADDDFEGWRDAVRALVVDGVAPDQVSWRVGDTIGELFAEHTRGSARAVGAFSVPRAFIDLAQTVVLHADDQRFALLHTLVDRLQCEPKLMEDQADPLIQRLTVMARAVRRDSHKMRAFIRFREVEDDIGVRYAAWFEPEHHIIRANASFFIDRFANMRWSILTPKLSIHWDGQRLTEAAGACKAEAAGGDPVEAVWNTYYASIFNPARVKIGAMLNEMPRKYWKNLPETALVPQLIATAQARESGMVAKSRIKIGGNVDLAWSSLREEAISCTRCHLHQQATQTVFGEGPVNAQLMFVGEQPGDQEDLAGRPFVGPAGRVFDRALAEAGIDRASVYVTNAVKHFKHEQRGKRRIHSRPDAGEVAACRWWIEQELALVKPRVTVALGATAARSLFGKTMTVNRERGHARKLPDGSAAWITIHPSYLLRLPDEAAKADEYRHFVNDLKMAAELLLP